MTQIAIKNLSVSYSSIEAVNEISADIKKGEFVCIVGPNGGGKTTLIKAILGLVKKNLGSITFNTKKPKISYVPQSINIDKAFPLSVLDALLCSFLRNGLHPFKRFSKEQKEKALQMLSRVDLSDYAKKQIGELSGGEFQRILIARALVSNPEIIILDEPTANVDIITRDKIYALLSELHKNGKTIIMVTHDLEMACSMATKVLCVNRTLLYCGAAPEIHLLNHLLYGCTSYCKEDKTDD